MSAASRIEGIAGGSRGSGGITGTGGKNVNPVYKESVPPKIPTGKPIDLTKPPKVPMTREPKQVHKPERHDTESHNQNPKTPKKDKPMVLSGRGKFLGNLAPGNWTGK